MQFEHICHTEYFHIYAAYGNVQMLFFMTMPAVFFLKHLLEIVFVKAIPAVAVFRSQS